MQLGMSPLPFRAWPSILNEHGSFAHMSMKIIPGVGWRPFLSGAPKFHFDNGGQAWVLEGLIKCHNLIMFDKKCQ